MLCQQPVNGEKCLLLKGHLIPCSPDPDGWISIPSNPWTRISGGLYQGGSHYYEPARLDFFDAVLTLTSQAPVTRWPTEEHRFYCTDGRDLPDPDGLARAVDWAYAHWQAGHRTLIRCQAGLNRSGLVTALVLYKAGIPTADAIDLIRSKRSPYALCNTRFVDYLRSLI
jgi:hypothetical protein